MATASVERPQSVESITVLQVGKFGVRVDEKTWLGVNDPVTPQQFQVGLGYRVAVVTSKTGKKYVNEIIGQEEKQEAPKASVATPAVQPKAQTTTTPSKLDAKDKRIVRQGLYQAALHSPVLSQFVTGNNVTEYLELVKQVANEGIKFVTEE
jgi:primosomal protein N'